MDESKGENSCVHCLTPFHRMPGMVAYSKRNIYKKMPGSEIVIVKALRLLFQYPIKKKCICDVCFHYLCTYFKNRKTASDAEEKLVEMRAVRDRGIEKGNSAERLLTGRTVVEKVFVSTELPKEIMYKMSEFWKQGKFLDAAILIGEYKFEAHKLVLVSASPLLHNLAEKMLTNYKLQVSLPADLEPDAMMSILTYLYDGILHLNTVNVYGIERIAQLLQIDTVLTFCQEFHAHVNKEFLTEDLVTRGGGSDSAEEDGYESDDSEAANVMFLHHGKDGSPFVSIGEGAVSEKIGFPPVAIRNGDLPGKAGDDTDKKLPNLKELGIDASTIGSEKNDENKSQVDNKNRQLSLQTKDAESGTVPVHSQGTVSKFIYNSTESTKGMQNLNFPLPVTNTDFLKTSWPSQVTKPMFNTLSVPGTLAAQEKNAVQFDPFQKPIECNPLVICEIVPIPATSKSTADQPQNVSSAKMSTLKPNSGQSYIKTSHPSENKPAKESTSDRSIINDDLFSEIIQSNWPSKEYDQVFYQTDKHLRQNTKCRRRATLIEKCNEFSVITGASVFLKIQDSEVQKNFLYSTDDLFFQYAGKGLKVIGGWMEKRIYNKVTKPSPSTNVSSNQKDKIGDEKMKTTEQGSVVNKNENVDLTEKIEPFIIPSLRELAKYVVSVSTDSKTFSVKKEENSNKGVLERPIEIDTLKELAKKALASLDEHEHNKDFKKESSINPNTQLSPSPEITSPKLQSKDDVSKSIQASLTTNETSLNDVHSDVAMETGSTPPSPVSKSKEEVKDLDSSSTAEMLPVKGDENEKDRQLVMSTSQEYQKYVPSSSDTRISELSRMDTEDSETQNQMQIPSLREKVQDSDLGSWDTKDIQVEKEGSSSKESVEDQSVITSNVGKAKDSCVIAEPEGNLSEEIAKPEGKLSEEIAEPEGKLSEEMVTDNTIEERQDSPSDVCPSDFVKDVVFTSADMEILTKVATSLCTEGNGQDQQSALSTLTEIAQTMVPPEANSNILGTATVSPKDDALNGLEKPSSAPVSEFSTVTRDASALDKNEILTKGETAENKKEIMAESMEKGKAEMTNNAEEGSEGHSLLPNVDGLASDCMPCSEDSLDDSEVNEDEALSTHFPMSTLEKLAKSVVPTLTDSELLTKEALAMCKEESEIGGQSPISSFDELAEGVDLTSVDGELLAQNTSTEDNAEMGQDGYNLVDPVTGLREKLLTSSDDKLIRNVETSQEMKDVRNESSSGQTTDLSTGQKTGSDSKSTGSFASEMSTNIAEKSSFTGVGISKNDGADSSCAGSRPPSSLSIVSDLVSDTSSNVPIGKEVKNRSTLSINTEKTEEDKSFFLEKRLKPLYTGKRKLSKLKEPIVYQEDRHNRHNTKMRRKATLIEKCYEYVIITGSFLFLKIQDNEMHKSYIFATDDLYSEYMRKGLRQTSGYAETREHSKDYIEMTQYLESLHSSPSDRPEKRIKDKKIIKESNRKDENKTNSTKDNSASTSTKDGEDVSEEKKVAFKHIDEHNGETVVSEKRRSLRQVRRPSLRGRLAKEFDEMSSDETEPDSDSERATKKRKSLDKVSDVFAEEKKVKKELSSIERAKRAKKRSATMPSLERAKMIKRDARISSPVKSTKSISPSKSAIIETETEEKQEEVTDSSATNTQSVASDETVASVGPVASTESDVNTKSAITTDSSVLSKYDDTIEAVATAASNVKLGTRKKSKKNLKTKHMKRMKKPSVSGKSPKSPGKEGSVSNRKSSSSSPRAKLSKKEKRKLFHLYFDHDHSYSLRHASDVEDSVDPKTGEDAICKYCKVLWSVDELNNVCKKWIECEGICQKWMHISCLPKKFPRPKDSAKKWSCPSCCETSPSRVHVSKRRSASIPSLEGEKIIMQGDGMSSPLTATESIIPSENSGEENPPVSFVTSTKSVVTDESLESFAMATATESVATDELVASSESVAMDTTTKSVDFDELVASSESIAMDTTTKSVAFDELVSSSELVAMDTTTKSVALDDLVASSESVAMDTTTKSVTIYDLVASSESVAMDTTTKLVAIDDLVASSESATMATATKSVATDEYVASSESDVMASTASAESVVTTGPDVLYHDYDDTFNLLKHIDEEHDYF